MRLAEHLVQPHHAYAGGFMHLMTAGIARSRILHSR
jgi:hypothetical protein